MNAINTIIGLLAQAPRMGTQDDEPEGSRYIQISDKLAKILARKLDAERINVLFVLKHAQSSNDEAVKSGGGTWTLNSMFAERLAALIKELEI
jgi:plasmid stabilization system protein ParE